MSHIIVTQPKKTQKRVLRIAEGMSFIEIQHIIDSMNKNTNRFGSNQSIAVYKAYQQGWRGNEIDNVASMIPKPLLMDRIKLSIRRIKWSF
tara:strand:- start:478 stop:750 length:273 start_codon:yes stop_codon:yes gene_type:complete